MRSVLSIYQQMEKKMKTFNRISLFILAALLFTACGPRPAPPSLDGNNPYAPQAGDGAMLRGEVRIASASLVTAESQPPQVTLNFAYFQPTPCYKLRVEVFPPDGQHRINVSAYAVTEKDKACTLMALSTPLQASLNLGSYAKGHFSVYVNDIKAGEFDS
jgi:hypothetical protein